MGKISLKDINSSTQKESKKEESLSHKKIHIIYKNRHKNVISTLEQTLRAARGCLMWTLIVILLTLSL